jgi:DNA-binding CsgD family transcriptional regulator
VGVVDDLIAARDAFERREWVAAYEGLTDVAASELAADDYARLATAAYLLGKRDDCIRAMQVSYQAHIEADDNRAAIRCAFWLAMVLITGGEVSVGAGWVARAQRHLEHLPDDVVERGYVLMHLMYQHIYQGDFGPAAELAAEVTDYGRRFRDADLVAVGLMAQGRMLLYSGQVPAGLRAFDEAMVGIAAGEVSPIFAGQVYCSMIEGCQEISDFGRAAQWTAALARWCDEQPGLVPFTGQCAVHRGQIMRLRGAFAEACEEFDLAVRRYAAAGASQAAGLAHAERGDVRRILGDVAGAERAYADATAHGHEPQPGLALLWLARGRTTASVNAVRRLLAEAQDPVNRSRVLPAAIDILIASGAGDEAVGLAEELETIAEAFGVPALQARAADAVGAVQLGADDPAAALRAWRKAAKMWSDVGAPYEVARARLGLGRAFRALGDEQSALTEFAAAQHSFDALGASPAARQAAGEATPSAPRGLTAREIEVLRLVASGRSNQQIAAALVVSDKTIARHLSNIFTKLGVSSRTAAAAFAFEQGLV